ncbi:hypothetical protein Tco_1044358 [Tanacetum coccineum]|uniref:Tf2-1-like SH3-like domain-containing protein n=1 Tax=Tanacetum coccineum TaxID=301880 RepID=A0ABQ5GS97_9ASTR
MHKDCSRGKKVFGGGKCGGSGGRGGSVSMTSHTGGGWLAKCSIDSNDGNGGELEGLNGRNEEKVGAPSLKVEGDFEVDEREKWKENDAILKNGNGVDEQVDRKGFFWVWCGRSTSWGKLNPRYIGPFKILAKVGTVAYRLELPKQLSCVHSTLHVSNLKKCLSDEPLAIPLEEIHIDENLNFIEEPIEIMDREVKLFKQSRIPIMKVRWNSRRGPEYTWEHEDQMQKKYPHLFVNPVSASQATS